MNIASFDLNLLKVLDALLREGSTVRAGQRVGLSQPAVSAALGRLRHALGDELFVRAGQGLQPTEVALALAPEVRRALAAVGRVLDGPGSVEPARLERHVFLCGADYVPEMLLPPLIRRLSREAPGVRISVLDEIFEHSLPRMREEAFDLLVLPRFDYPDDLDHRPLLTAPLAFVARPDHPVLTRAGIAPGETVPLDLYCDLGHARWAMDLASIAAPATEDEVVNRLGRARRVVATVPTFASLATLVAETDLVAVLPARFALRDAARGRLAIWRPPVPTGPVEICLVWHRRQTASPAHRWLRDLVAEVAAGIEGDPVEPGA